MWKISALAEETFNVYVYYVDEPYEKSLADVAAMAYAVHGQRYRDGEVAEWLCELYTAQWEPTQEEVKEGV
jgi:hypothetical protein